MKSEIIQSLTEDFESFAHETDGVEFWFARDLQKLLGYEQWRNFNLVIDKAKVACQNAGQVVEDHFVAASKKVELGSGAIREIKDVMLTRYACYLIAQNGDPRKDEIAFAMNYFAVQTRKQEILEKRITEWKRLQAREKLSLSEKNLSGVMYERGVDDRGFAIIRSRGDKALFGGYTTGQMKKKLDVSKNRPLADFLPTITIKAKDFANEITIFNINKDEQLQGKEAIGQEHVRNNSEVRKLLNKRGIFPENLPAEEDIKKLQRRVKAQDKKMLNQVQKLNQNKPKSWEY